VLPATDVGMVAVEDRQRGEQVQARWFERFTDRARRVVVLAQEEARLLNHNYVGTEHILLGLIHESQGVAAQVLIRLGAGLDRVRQQVIQLLSGYAVGGEEAVARARLVSMTVPEELREAEEQLAQVRRQKEAAIDAEEFERAAGLRDQERQLLARVAEQEQAWTAGVDLGAVIQENQNLHREVERLLELLHRHGIEPNGGTAETA
jgi:ATP-dependent Clp protease ATP-binding subunit ClpA